MARAAEFIKPCVVRVVQAETAGTVSVRDPLRHTLAHGLWAETTLYPVLMVLDGDELDQLSVPPEWTGGGAGSKLVRLAQSGRPEGLSLWTFQSNEGAQRFH